MARGGGCYFLPDEIITYILKSFPVKSIVRLRCVCKRWKNLFKTPYFITEHLSHSDRKNPFLLLHEVNYEHGSSSLRLLNHKLETVEVLRTPSINSFRRQRWKILGSCNGLLCVQVYEFGPKYPTSFFLWNPAIREVREVPHAYDDYRRFCSVGFGFSSVISDYKIVIFYNQTFTEDGEIDDRVEVYSLSTDSWKELEIEPLWDAVGDLDDGLLEVLSESEAVSVDGTIFWLVPNKVVSFNIVTEVFTVTSIPTEDGMYLIGPGVYDNRLACHFGVEAESGPHSICVWLVEEVASESGKILKSTRKNRTKQMPAVSLVDTLCIWRNEIVCLNDTETDVQGGPQCVLYLFDLVTNEKRTFNCSGGYDGCYPLNYEKSLVSVCSTQAELSGSEI